MYKKFTHSLVKSIELKYETAENGRFYIIPSGEKLPSVTTVLGKINNSWLEEWYERIGKEKAERISAKATKRGTIIHSIAEKYLLNEENYLKGILPHHIITFNTIKEVLDKHVGIVYGIEIPLYSIALNTAGRVDVVAEFNRIPSIIDFKTSKKKKSEEQIYSYFLQTTCYSMMFEKMYGIHIPQIVIIMAIDDEPNAYIFIKNRNKYVKEVLKIFAGK